MSTTFTPEQQMEQKGALDFLPKRLRTQAQLPFEQWVLKKAESIKKQCQAAEQIRAQISTTLKRRFRAQSKSDTFGFFASDSTVWLGDAAGLEFTGLHFIPVVQPAVRANLSALITAQVRVQVEATNKKNQQLKGAASVADGVAQYIDSLQWDDIVEARINEMAQLEYGYGIKVEECDGDELEDTTGWADEEIGEQGEYACACGSRGQFEGETQDDPEGSGLKITNCPECQNPAVVTKEPSSEMFSVPQFGQQKSKSTKTVIASSYEIRIDELKSQGGNLDGANWFEYHHLQTLSELEEENPEIEYGVPEEWSYPLRWQHSLETGTGYAKWTPAEQRECEIYETREIYLRSDEYRHRVEPADYKLVIRGEVVFEVKRGDRTIEKCPNGLFIKVTGKHLVNAKENRDFRKEWSYGGFLPDSKSFWPQPLVVLIAIEKDMANMYTIDIQHRERNSVTNTVFDVEQFDAESFERDLVPTRPGLERDRPIQDYVTTLQPPAMSRAMEGVEFIRNLLPDISLIQPAMVGAQPKAGDPYAAQLLQKQSSLGVLSPALKSKAQAKVRHMKNSARYAQSWPRERFEYIRDRFGNEWKDEDVEAFCECNVDRDLEFTYQEGSEVPTSLIEREIKFQALLTQLMTLAAQLENPDLVPKEMVAQLVEYAGADVDIDNIEGNERLAESRYEKLKAVRKQAGDPPNPDIIDQMMNAPDFWPLPEENHKVHIEFYADQQLGLASEEKIDLGLIAMCQMMIKRHKDAAVGEAQQESQATVEAKQPIIDAQQQIAAQGQQQEQATNGAQSQAEQMKAQAEDERTQQQQQHEAGQTASAQAHEKHIQAQDHAHEQGMAAMQAVQAAEVAKRQPKMAAQ